MVIDHKQLLLLSLRQHRYSEASSKEWQVLLTDDAYMACTSTQEDHCRAALIVKELLAGQ